MSNRLTLPLLLLAALLAAGAFFWLSGDERRPSSGARTAPDPATALEAPPAELAAPSLAEAAPGATQPARVAQDTPAVPERVARPADDGARVAVSGQVLDRFGAPVALARVALGAQTGFPMDLELEQQFPWLARQRTETDAEGRFRFAAPRARSRGACAGFR